MSKTQKLKFIISVYILLLSLNLFSQNFQWAKTYDSSEYSVILDIDVDTEGNLYSTGFFNGYVDFDPALETYNYLFCDTSEGDIFISKLNSNGDFQWVISLGSQFSYGEYANSIKVDSNGDIIVTGIFYDTVDFDPSENIYNMTSLGYPNTFICKYDTDGNFIWGKQFEASSSSSIAGKELFINDSNIYLVGSFNGTVNFDAEVSNFSLTSYGDTSDIFFCKLDLLGNFIWAKKIGNSGGDFGNSIFVDNNNYLYITGGFWGNVDFDPNSSVYYLNSAGYNDIFLAKYDDLGNFIYAKSLPGVLYADSGNSIKVDLNGNIYLTGTFRDTVDFGTSGNQFNLTSNGENDIFISKFNSNFDLIWAKNIGGISYDSATSLSINNQTNSIYITGLFEDVVDFDPSNMSHNLNSNGGYDFFVAKFDMDSNFIWAGSFGGNQPTNYGLNDVGYSIVSKFNNIYFGGSFEGTVDFDITPNNFNYTNISGYKNAFICKYEEPVLNISEETTSPLLYPNPFENNINVILNKPSLIIIYNLLGKEVFRKSAINSCDINLSSLKNGYYIINVKDNNSTYRLKLFKSK